MKLAVILFLLSSLSLNSFAQPATQWHKAYGSTNEYEAFQRAIQTNDGGYIAIGYAAANGDDVTAHHDTPPNLGRDVWIVKTSATGAISWAKCYGGTNQDIGYWIEQTSDKGYIFCGETRSNDGDVSGNHGSSISYGDAWVVKLDGAGTIQWQKCLGGSTNDRADCIKQTQDGGYIFAGITTSVNGDVTAPKGGTDMWVVKLKANGDIDWEKCYGGTKSDFATSILEAADGNFIVAGTTSSSDGDVSTAKGANDGWVLKLSTTGAIAWEKTLGGTKNDALYSIVELPSSAGFVFSGYTVSTDGDLTTNKGVNDLWLINVNNTGSVLWSKTYGGTNVDNGVQSVLGINNSIFVIGSSSSADGDVTGNHGMSEMWLLSVKLDGTLEWQKTYGGSKGDVGMSIAKTSDNALVLAGAVSSTDGDAAGSGNHSTGNSDGWIVKLNAYAGIGEGEERKSGIVVYPTVTNGAIYARLPLNNAGATVQLIDLLGRPVQVNTTGNGDMLTITPVNISAGTYLLSINTGNEISTHRIVYQP